MKRSVFIGSMAAVMLVAASAGRVAAQRGGAAAPKLEVEPLWPKPFPVAKHWII